MVLEGRVISRRDYFEHFVGVVEAVVLLTERISVLLVIGVIEIDEITFLVHEGVGNDSLLGIQPKQIIVRLQFRARLVLQGAHFDWIQVLFQEFEVSSDEINVGWVLWLLVI